MRQMSLHERAEISAYIIHQIRVQGDPNSTSVGVRDSHNFICTHFCNMVTLHS